MFSLLSFIHFCYLGELAEDAGESKHKDFRFVRTHRTRKSSSTLTVTDTFENSWCSSDPFISSKGRDIHVKAGLPREVLALLNEPLNNPNKVRFPEEWEEEDEEEEDSSDEEEEDGGDSLGEEEAGDSTEEEEDSVEEGGKDKGGSESQDEMDTSN